jgi:hypothetical protein
VSVMAEVKIELPVPYCCLNTRKVHLDIYRPIDFTENSVTRKSADIPTRVKMKSLHVKCTYFSLYNSRSNYDFVDTKMSEFI